MSILDKLYEKKDLLAYIDYRTTLIKNSTENSILSGKPKDREKIRQRLKGRLAELGRLRHFIEQGTLKKEAKRMCRHQAKRKKDGD